MRLVTVTRTPARLELRIRAHHMALVGFGAAFVALAGLSIWLLAYDSVVSVKDRILRYELRFLGLTVVEEVALPADHVQSVSIELVVIGISRSNEVRIEAPPAPFRLWFPNADGDQKQRVVDGLQQALSSPDGRFEHRDNGTALGLIVAAIPLFGGLAMLWFLQTVVVVGDRGRGTLVIDRRRLVWPQPDRRIFRIEKIQRIEPIEVRMVSARGQTTTSYHVGLRLDHEAVASVTYGPIFTREDAQVVSDAIGRWLADARRR